MPSNHAPETTPAIVLALQTFFTRKQSAFVEAICREASRSIPGVKCAFDEGAALHMTTGSWKVTTAQFAAAVANFPSRVGNMEPLAVRITLEEKSFRPGTRHFFFIPENSAPLLAYHAEVQRRLGYAFLPFREIDVVGRWWPHVTLIDGPEESIEAAHSFLARLREITSLETAAVALVTFGPIQVHAEVPATTP